MRTNWNPTWVVSTLRRAFGAVLILALAGAAGPAESSGDWTSPITNSSDPTNVINADEGHPGPSGNPPMDADPITYSPNYEWEWSMVYEWSVDLSLFGEVPVFVLTDDSHHSPIKNEVYPPDLENDPFLELNDEAIYSLAVY
ncbi:MAG: hypothetical protein P9M08_11990 [Candidatus Erginobacter occultus]|nr:hypothetical protein [Candidatus Erginobacter occultus]